MNKSHQEKQNVIPFAHTFNGISSRDLDDIFEWLRDHEYLSEKGTTFKTAFWDLFIHEKK